MAWVEWAWDLSYRLEPLLVDRKFFEKRELNNPKNGHRDPKFTPKMSYFWGVFYYLKRTGGKAPYNCGDCTWESLINGAVEYNSAEHKGVNHRKKIEDFLKDSGLRKAGEK
jgi:hypothetical protein